MASTIGIKIANGEFYSIVEENSRIKKRLILTTVHDRQPSVQIDLYKSFTRTMADALYIGSLVLENLRPQPKGAPSIELIINSNPDGEINAEAIDLDTSTKKERQSLNISLRSLDEDNREYEMPDFELEPDEAPRTRGRYDREEEKHEDYGRRKFPWLIVICTLLILTAIALAIWIFLFRGGGSVGVITGRTQQLSQAAPAQQTAQAVQNPPPQTAPQTATPTATQTATQAAPPAAAQAPPPTAQAPPAAPAQTASSSAAVPAQTTPPPAAPAQTASTQTAPAQAASPPAAQTAPAAQSSPPPVIQAPAQAPASSTAAGRDRAAAPVASYAIPSVIPSEGVPYTVRYGDTLWDIAEAFYRNPMLYPRIARFNNIRNPDIIISGSTIRVPPRS